MEEQSQVEMGAKSPKEVPSMSSVFASGGALGPKDVLELNLKVRRYCGTLDRLRLFAV